MKVETYKCDICGKQKGEVNHWLYALLAEDEMKIRKFPLHPKNYGGIPPEAIHLCGAECVQKKVNEFLSKVSP